MSRRERGKKLKQQHPMTRKLLIFGCTVSVLFYSCTLSEKKNLTFTDADVNTQVRQAVALVDSLVNARHPDPISFLANLAKAERALQQPSLTERFIQLERVRYYYEYQKKFDLNLQYADSTFQLFEERYDDPGYQMHYLYSLLTKANALKEKRLYGMSINHLLQGWGVIEPDKSPCLAFKYLEMLGSISYEQESYFESIDYYNQAWKILPTCRRENDFNQLVKNYQYHQNIASNYSELNIPDSADYYNNLSLNILDDSAERLVENENQKRFLKVARGVALGNKASEVLKLGQADEAEQLWKESIRINLQRGFANEHAQLMQLWLAEYYIESDRLEEARERLDLARNWLDNHRSETGELRWSRMNWQWLDKMGDHEEAYSAYQNYISLNQSFNESKTTLAALDLANQIQHQEQQQNIEHLETEAKIRNMHLFFISFISLLVVIILFLIWKNWKESKVRVQHLKELNRTIAGKNDQLEKSNRAITKIMNIIAHDLRSPLVGVKEVSFLLKEDEHLSKEKRNWAYMIHEASEHSMNLIKKILNFDFTTSDFNSLSFQKEPVELRSFLRICVDILQMQANKKHQTIHLEVDDPIICFMDKDSITRVINNITSNAMKFSPTGSSILIKLEQMDEKIKISIQDEGIGIPKKFQESVFDMFTQAKRPGTNNESSFGLGLSISKQIVEVHEGTIWFESEVHSGTVFYIELPASKTLQKIK